MELGVNLNYLLKNTRDYSPENTVRQAIYAKELGFTVLDYVSDIGREDWKAHAERIHGLFEENGIVVHQSHAPFNRYNKTRSHEEFYPYVLRSVEAAAIRRAKEENDGGLKS